jgi:hypothetical protein
MLILITASWAGPVQGTHGIQSNFAYDWGLALATTYLHVPIEARVMPTLQAIVTS